MEENLSDLESKRFSGENVATVKLIKFDLDQRRDILSAVQFNQKRADLFERVTLLKKETDLTVADYFETEWYKRLQMNFRKWLRKRMNPEDFAPERNLILPHYFSIYQLAVLRLLTGYDKTSVDYILNRPEKAGAICWTAPSTLLVKKLRNHLKNALSTRYSVEALEFKEKFKLEIEGSIEQIFKVLFDQPQISTYLVDAEQIIDQILSDMQNRFESAENGSTIEKAVALFAMSEMKMKFESDATIRLVRFFGPNTSEKGIKIDLNFGSNERECVYTCLGSYYSLFKRTFERLAAIISRGKVDEVGEQLWDCDLDSLLREHLDSSELLFSRICRNFESLKWIRTKECLDELASIETNVFDVDKAIDFFSRLVEAKNDLFSKEHVVVGSVFEVNCAPILDEMISTVVEAESRILSTIVEAKNLMIEGLKSFADALTEAAKPEHCLEFEGVQKHESLIRALKIKYSKGIKEKSRSLLRIWCFATLSLDENEITFNHTDLLLPLRIKHLMKQCKLVIKSQLKIKRAKVRAIANGFAGELNVFYDRIRKLQTDSAVMNVEKQLGKAVELGSEMNRCLEKIFELEPSMSTLSLRDRNRTNAASFQRSITNLIKALECCAQINALYTNLKSCVCSSLNINEARLETESISKRLKAIKKLKEDWTPNFIKVLEFYEHKIEFLNEGFEIAFVLCNKTVIRHYWSQMESIIGVKSTELSSLSFNNILSSRIRSKLPAIRDFSNKHKNEITSSALLSELEQLWEHCDSDMSSLDGQLAVLQKIYEIRELLLGRKNNLLSSTSGGTEDLLRKMHEIEVVFIDIIHCFREARIYSDQFDFDFYKSRIANVSANPFLETFSLNSLESHLADLKLATETAKTKMLARMSRESRRNGRIYLAGIQELCPALANTQTDHHELFKNLFQYIYPELEFITVSAKNLLESVTSSNGQTLQIVPNGPFMGRKLETERSSLPFLFNSLILKIRWQIKRSINELVDSLLDPANGDTNHFDEHLRKCPTQIVHVAMNAVVSEMDQSEIRRIIDNLIRISQTKSFRSTNPHLAEYIRENNGLWTQNSEFSVHRSPGFFVGDLNGSNQKRGNHNAIVIRFKHWELEFNGDFVTPPSKAPRIADFKQTIGSLMIAFQQHGRCTLYGLIGIGKTSTITYLASLLGFSVLKYDCNDFFEMNSVFRSIELASRNDVWIVLRNAEALSTPVRETLLQSIMTIKTNGKFACFMTYNVHNELDVGQMNSGLFPGIMVRSVNSSDLEINPIRTANFIKRIIVEEMLNLGYTDYDQMVDNCIDLYESLAANQNVILCGPPGTGKSTCLKILKSALRAAFLKSKQTIRPVEFVRIFPQQLGEKELFGLSDDFSKYLRSYLTNILECCSASNLNKIIHVFDFDMNYPRQKAHRLFDLLITKAFVDHEGNLLAKNANFIFETDSLGLFSSQHIASAKIVYFDHSTISGPSRVSCFLRGFKTRLTDRSLEILGFLCHEILLKCQTSDEFVTFSGLFEGFVVEFEMAHDRRSSQLFSIFQPHLIFGWFYFALIWSYGIRWPTDFDEFLRNLITKVHHENSGQVDFMNLFAEYSNFPAKSSVFSVQFRGLEHIAATTHKVLEPATETVIEQYTGNVDFSTSYWTFWPTFSSKYKNQITRGFVHRNYLSDRQSNICQELFRLLIFSRRSFITFDAVTWDEIQLVPMTVLVNDQTADQACSLTCSHPEFGIILNDAIGVNASKIAQKFASVKTLILDDLNETIDPKAFEIIRNSLDQDEEPECYRYFCCSPLSYRDCNISKRFLRHFALINTTNFSGKILRDAVLDIVAKKSTSSMSLTDTENSELIAKIDEILDFYVIKNKNFPRYVRGVGDTYRLIAKTIAKLEIFADDETYLRPIEFLECEILKLVNRLSSPIQKREPTIFIYSYLSPNREMIVLRNETELMKLLSDLIANRSRSIILNERFANDFNDLFNLLMHEQTNGFVLSGHTSKRLAHYLRLACSILKFNISEIYEHCDFNQAVLEACRRRIVSQTRTVLFCKINKNTSKKFKTLVFDTIRRGFYERGNETKLFLLEQGVFVKNMVEEKLFVSDTVYAYIRLIVILDCFSLEELYWESPGYRLLENVHFKEWEREDVFDYCVRKRGDSQIFSDELIEYLIEAVFEYRKIGRKSVFDCFEHILANFRNIGSSSLIADENYDILNGRLNTISPKITKLKKSRKSLMRRIAEIQKRLVFVTRRKDDLADECDEIKSSMKLVDEQLKEIRDNLEQVSTRITYNEKQIDMSSLKIFEINKKINLMSIIKMCEADKYKSNDLRFRILCYFFDVQIQKRFEMDRKTNYMMAFVDHLKTNCVEYKLSEFWENGISSDKFDYLTQQLDKYAVTQTESPLQVLFSWLLTMLEYQKLKSKGSDLDKEHCQLLRKLCVPNHDRQVLVAKLSAKRISRSAHQEDIEQLTEILNELQQKVDRVNVGLNQLEVSFDLLNQYKSLRRDLNMDNANQALIERLICAMIHSLFGPLRSMERDYLLGKWLGNADRMLNVNPNIQEILPLRMIAFERVADVVRDPKQLQDLFIVETSQTSLVFDRPQIYLPLLAKMYPLASVQRLCFVPTNQQFQQCLKDEITILLVESARMANELVCSVHEALLSVNNRLKFVIVVEDELTDSFDFSISKFSVIRSELTMLAFGRELRESALRLLNPDLLTEWMNVVREIANLQRAVSTEVLEFSNVLATTDVNEFSEEIRVKREISTGLVVELESKKAYLLSLEKIFDQYGVFVEFTKSIFECVGKYLCGRVVSFAKQLMDWHTNAISVRINRLDELSHHYNIYVSLNTFHYVSRRLESAADQIQFGFDLLCSILNFERDSAINDLYVQYITTGFCGRVEDNTGLKIDKLPEAVWIELKKITSLPGLGRIIEDVSENLEEWIRIVCVDENYSMRLDLPYPYRHCHCLQKLCVLRAIKPDLIHIGIRECVRDFFSGSGVRRCHLDQIERFDEAFVRDRRIASYNPFFAIENTSSNYLSLRIGRRIDWINEDEFDRGDLRTKKRIRSISEREISRSIIAFDKQTLFKLMDFAEQKQIELHLRGFDDRKAFWMLKRNWPIILDDYSISEKRFNPVIVDSLSSDFNDIREFMDSHGLSNRIMNQCDDEIDAFAFLTFLMNIELCRRVLHTSCFKIDCTLDQYVTWIENFDSKQSEVDVVQFISEIMERFVPQSNHPQTAHILESIFTHLRSIKSQNTFDECQTQSIQLFLPQKLRKSVCRNQCNRVLNAILQKDNKKCCVDIEFKQALVDYNTTISRTESFLDKIEKAIPVGIGRFVNHIASGELKKLFALEIETLSRIMEDIGRELRDLLVNLKGRYFLEDKHRVILEAMDRGKVPLNWLDDLKLNRSTDQSQFIDLIVLRFHYLKCSLLLESMHILDLRLLINPELFLAQIAAVNKNDEQYRLVYCLPSELENTFPDLANETPSFTELIKRLEFEYDFYFDDLKSQDFAVETRHLQQPQRNSIVGEIVQIDRLSLIDNFVCKDLIVESAKKGFLIRGLVLNNVKVNSGFKLDSSDRSVDEPPQKLDMICVFVVPNNLQIERDSIYVPVFHTTVPTLKDDLDSKDRLPFARIGFSKTDDNFDFGQNWNSHVSCDANGLNEKEQMIVRLVQ